MFEKVYTLWYFCDCPREGVADFKGKPHVFVSEWSEEGDDYGDAFLLKPIDAETFRLVMEDAAIGHRWKEAVEQGLTTFDSHPVSPEDRIRIEEIKRLLRIPLTIDPARAKQAYPVRSWLEPVPLGVETGNVIRLNAEFCWQSAPRPWEDMELPAVTVRWSLPDAEMR